MDLVYVRPTGRRSGRPWEPGDKGGWYFRAQLALSHPWAVLAWLTVLPMQESDQLESAHEDQGWMQHQRQVHGSPAHPQAASQRVNRQPSARDAHS